MDNMPYYNIPVPEDVNRKKRSKLPIVLAVVAVVIIGLVILATVFGRPFLAKQAFNSGDYAKVISLLEGKTGKNEDLNAMLYKAKAQTAFAGGKYSIVVDYLDRLDPEELGDEYNKMLLQSEAQVAFAKKKYVDAYQLLCELDGKEEIDIYEETVAGVAGIYNKTVDEGLKAYDENKLLEALEEYEGIIDDDAVQDHAVEKMAEACKIPSPLTYLMIYRLPDGGFKESVIAKVNEDPDSKAILESTFKTVGTWKTVRYEGNGVTLSTSDIGETTLIFNDNSTVEADFAGDEAVGSWSATADGAVIDEDVNPVHLTYDGDTLVMQIDFLKFIMEKQ